MDIETRISADRLGAGFRAPIGEMRNKPGIRASDPTRHDASETALAPRVALADDHPEMLEETRWLLEPDFRVVGLAREGAGLLAAVEESRPDGVVVDCEMPGMSGIEAAREIIRRGLCAAVVTLTTHRDRQLIRKAQEAGIRGYVLKEDAGEELIPALRAVLAGGSYLSRGARLAAAE